jgi:hypothetical protein
MAPPIWLDESGHTRLVRACLRCGREAPIYRFRVEHRKLIGPRLFAVASYTNWCGHAQEFIPLPERGGWCRCSERPHRNAGERRSVARALGVPTPCLPALHVAGIVGQGNAEWLYEGHYSGRGPI